MLVPLLAAVTIAHGFTALTLRRSILTEKVSRRGYHLSREYSVDPLEILFVREVMRSNIVAFPAQATPHELVASVHEDHERRGQILYPVIDVEDRLAGVITLHDLRQLLEKGHGDTRPLGEVAQCDPVVAYADEPLRVVVNRMAETGFTRLPVVENSKTRKLVGMISLSDLLRARTRSLEEERHRERVLRIRLPFGSRAASPDAP
jgi:chloride channel protein, CIC family